MLDNNSIFLIIVKVVSVLSFLSIIPGFLILKNYRKFKTKAGVYLAAFLLWLCTLIFFDVIVALLLMTISEPMSFLNERNAPILLVFIVIPWLAAFRLMRTFLDTIREKTTVLNDRGN
jgi:hypothetical protein